KSSGPGRLPVGQAAAVYQSSEDIGNRPETKVAKQPGQALFRSVQTNIMAESPQPTRRQPGLIRIKLPGMHKSNEGPAFAVDGVEAVPGAKIGIQPEIAAAAYRDWVTKPAVYGHGKFANHTRRPRDKVRPLRCLSDAVAIVVSRVHAGIDGETLLDQDV